MRNLRLTGELFETPEEVVGWLGAVQSQDYGPAKWSVGQRVRDGSGVTDAALDRAFAEGKFLRTHVLRPTWHFVLPEDIRWLLEATGRRVHALNAFMNRQLELDAATLTRSTTLMADALQGGNQMTRKELDAVLERAGIVSSGQRSSYIMMTAELNGVICSGAMKGKQHTYALLAERAPNARRLTPDEALGELTRRYFTSHGPATVKDFQAWSSLTITAIKQGLEMAGSELAHEVIDGVEFWFASSEPSMVTRAKSPTVDLVQGYDEYVNGYGETKYLLDASGVLRSTPQDRSIFVLSVLLDGQVAGHWRRTIKKGSVSIQVALYRPFDKDQTAALHAAADKHGEFLGLPATVVTTLIDR
jgi:hypothetical protein